MQAPVCAVTVAHFISSQPAPAFVLPPHHLPAVQSKGGGIDWVKPHSLFHKWEQMLNLRKPSSHLNRFQSQLSDSLTTGFSPCPAWWLKRKFIFSSLLLGFRKNHHSLTAISFWWWVIFLGTWSTWQFVLWLLDRKTQQPTEWAVLALNTLTQSSHLF